MGHYRMSRNQRLITQARWGLFYFLPSLNLIKGTTRGRILNDIYTVLCAVLQERWGKPHAGRMCVAPLAWLVQRSNIAHNKEYVITNHNQL